MFASPESTHPICSVFTLLITPHNIGKGYRYTRTTTRKEPDWKKAYVFIDPNYHPTNITTQEAKEQLMKDWTLFSFHSSFIQQTITICWFLFTTHLVLTSRSLASLLETVLEATSHRLQVTHATRSLTSATRTLQRPVVYSISPFHSKHIQCLILASG